MKLDLEMHLTNEIITPASGLVVSLDDLKTHIRWPKDDHSEDVLMTTFINAATTQAELYTRRVLAKTTYKTLIDEFSSYVTLDIHPIDVETLTVSYYDVDDELQVLDDAEYYIHSGGTDHYTTIEFYGTMPELYDKYKAVEIEFEAGYETVPEPIKVGILMRAATYFENRQNEVAGTFSKVLYGTEQLWFPYKLI